MQGDALDEGVPGMRMVTTADRHGWTWPIDGQGWLLNELERRGFDVGVLPMLRVRERPRARPQ
jgi:hypothetical protein